MYLCLYRHSRHVHEVPPQKQHSESSERKPKLYTYVFDFVCAIEGYFYLSLALVPISCRHGMLCNVVAVV
jgi:hypothetical protein